jgi:hypothetical protein
VVKEKVMSSQLEGTIGKNDMKQEVGVAWQIWGEKIQMILCDGSLCSVTRNEFLEDCDWLVEYFDELLDQLVNNEYLTQWDRDIIYAYFDGDPGLLPTIQYGMTVENVE